MVCEACQPIIAYGSLNPPLSAHYVKTHSPLYSSPRKNEADEKDEKINNLPSEGVGSVAEWRTSLCELHDGHREGLSRWPAQQERRDEQVPQYHGIDQLEKESSVRLVAHASC